MPSQKMIDRLTDAIKVLHSEGIHPSPDRINERMGRSVTSGLKGWECEHRRKLFKELGIRLRRTSFNDPDNQRPDWYNL